MLSAYFDDCGEFGGHKETIEILRIDGILNGILTVYDKSCQDENYPKPNILNSKIYPLNENGLGSIQTYLSKLLLKNFTYEGTSNGGRLFTVKTIYRNKDEYHNTHLRLNIWYDDINSSWSEFQNLKNVIQK